MQSSILTFIEFHIRYLNFTYYSVSRKSGAFRRQKETKKARLDEVEGKIGDLFQQREMILSDLKEIDQKKELARDIINS